MRLSRLTPRLALALLAGVLIPFGVLAQTGPPPAPTAPHPGHFHHLRRCLAILDLSDQQKADIQAVLEAAKPALQADAAAVHAARATLHADAEATPPDACLVGNDFLALRAALQTLRGELESVRGQIMAQLTPDQQSKLEGCLEAPRLDAAPPADAGPTPAPDQLD